MLIIKTTDNNTVYYIQMPKAAYHDIVYGIRGGTKYVHIEADPNVEIDHNIKITKFDSSLKEIELEEIFIDYSKIISIEWIAK